MSRPAFPSPEWADAHGTIVPQEYGLTKREYAAIHIAAAIASRRTVHADEANVAAVAVALADAVLREAGE